MRAGTYASALSIPTSANALSIRGGYDAAFKRSGVGTNVVTITGSGTGVTVTGRTANLEQLTINSGSPSGAGSSAYGVAALSSAIVTVRNSTVTAAPGVAGAAPAAQAASGAATCVRVERSGLGDHHDPELQSLSDD